MDTKDPCSLIRAFIVRLQTTMYRQQRPRSACASIAVWSGPPLSGFRLPCMDSEDPDKLTHPCSLIRAFIVRLQTPINRQQRPRSACASMQSNKGLHHPLTNPCIYSKSQDHLRNHAVWSGPSYSHVRTVKTHISLHIHTVWSGPSFSAFYTPIYRQQRPRSAFTSMQSDQGLHCSLTHSYVWTAKTQVGLHIHKSDQGLHWPLTDSHVWTTKTQIDPHIQAVWSGPSLSVYRLPCMDGKDPDWPTHPSSLIRAFIICLQTPMLDSKDPDWPAHPYTDQGLHSHSYRKYYHYD